MSPPCPDSTEALDAEISTPSEAVVETLRRNPGDACVLGAAGKMGFHLCCMLQQALRRLDRNDRIFAVSRFRSVRTRAAFENAGIEVLVADLSTTEGIASLPELPNVFFLAGVKFGTADDPALLQRMNVDVPRLVAERYRDSRIVALSTGCVYSFTAPESGGSTEEDPTDPPGAYARSCLGREQAFIDAAADHGTCSALIRLNYAIDLRYGVLVDLAQQILAGQPIDLTTGAVNLIWQGDALRHIVQSLDQVSAPPFLLNVTGPKVLQVRDLAEELGRRLHMPVQFSGKEAPAAWLSNATKAHRLFGAPEIPLEQMLDWVAEWVGADREVLGKPTRFQTRDGNY